MLLECRAWWSQRWRTDEPGGWNGKGTRKYWCYSFAKRASACVQGFVTERCQYTPIVRCESERKLTTNCQSSREPLFQNICNSMQILLFPPRLLLLVYMTISSFGMAIFTSGVILHLAMWLLHLSLNRKINWSPSFTDLTADIITTRTSYQQRNGTLNSTVI